MKLDDHTRGFFNHVAYVEVRVLWTLINCSGREAVGGIENRQIITKETEHQVRSGMV